MSGECMVCKNKFNKTDHIPYILDCMDTLCSKCVNHYVESYTKEGVPKGEFKCPECCNTTKSTNKINKACLPKDNAPINNNANAAPIGNEFEVTIKFLDGSRTNFRVTKTMTVAQLISKISQEKGINANQLKLAFKMPLNETSKTLEFYKITKPVTIMQVDYLKGGI